MRLGLLANAMHQQKRSRSSSLETCSSYATRLIQDLVIRVQSTPSWKRMQQTIEDLRSQIETLEVQRRMLLIKRPGGSKKGRRIIKRNFDRAYNTLMLAYFVATPMYTEALFRRRYRVSKPIFERVYNACLNHPCFEHKANAAGRLGIHPLVKVTACFRHLAYGTSADQLDEQLQIAESTFLETRQSFCDVRFLFLEPSFSDFVFRLLFKSLRISTCHRLTTAWPKNFVRCMSSLDGQVF